MTQNDYFDHIQWLLKQHKEEPLPTQKAGAAVLVPIIYSAKPTLLFTVRSMHLRQHPGEVSFPGGMTEDADLDNLEMTALRETQEEVGLLPSQFKVLGRLNSVQSISGVIVSPIVAGTSNIDGLNVNTDEVSKAFQVPLQFFLDNPAEYRLVERNAKQVRIPYYQLDGEYIWGLTAFITQQFVNRLHQRNT